MHAWRMASGELKMEASPMRLAKATRAEVGTGWACAQASASKSSVAKAPFARWRAAGGGKEVAADGDTEVSFAAVVTKRL